VPAVLVVLAALGAGAASAQDAATEADQAPALTQPAESAPEPSGNPGTEASPAPPPAATAPGVLDPADFAGSLTPKGDSLAAGTEAAGEPLKSPFDQDEELAEYDPWLPFNEKTFAFNHGLDRYVLKPAAKAYDKVVPNWVERAVRNMFHNVASFRRIVSTALQGRFNDMGQEFGRFVINTFFGLGGFVDAAPSFGVPEGTTADMGQTFGVWGAGPGPYLVLPLLPPLTVRDAFGFAFDTALDPLTWVAPIGAAFAVNAEKTINERALNLEFYEDVEENVFDLYSAVRNAYLQRRSHAVRDGRIRSLFFRRERLILTGPHGQ
jgi:phospholipid-binding lipoprotein MlaA